MDYIEFTIYEGFKLRTNWELDIKARDVLKDKITSANGDVLLRVRRSGKGYVIFRDYKIEGVDTSREIEIETKKCKHHWWHAKLYAKVKVDDLLS